jgi:hypothetical protein
LQIPANFVLWSTGIAMNPFAQRLTSLLPNQSHRKAIEVDAHLRVKGAPRGDVYAIGDCATVSTIHMPERERALMLCCRAQIETSVVAHLLELVDEADKDKNGKIDFDEFEYMVARIREKIPLAEPHVEKVRELFESYDSDADNSLSLNELAELLTKVGTRITSLPAVRPRLLVLPTLFRP